MKVKREIIVIVTICLVIAATIRVESIQEYRYYFPVIYQYQCGGRTSMGVWSYIAQEATINNVLNPSAEIAANFAAVGGGTMTRVTTSSFFGVRTYRIQTAANDEGGTFTLDALANAIHYVTVRVRGTIPTWDWSLDNAAYTVPVELLDYDGDWSLYGLQFPAAQANGSTTFYIRQNGAGVGDFNIDGVQVEQKTSWTTYCDGTRDGCEWLGAEHASQSQRSALSRAGGTVTDFDDLNFFIDGFVGAGKSPITLNIDSFALLPGGELNSQKTNVRTFTLTGWISATDLEDLNAKRQAIIEAVAINQTPENQPIVLRYNGAVVVKEISAYYQAGLAGNIEGQWECLEQNFALRFLATDPNFREVGESSDILDTNDAATLRYAAGRLRSTGQWDDLGLTANPAVGGIIRAIAIDPDDVDNVYFAGSFTNMDGVAGRDYIALYHPSTDTWETVGGASDLGSGVLALAFGPDGLLYVGGTFVNAAGIAAADYIATWDGAAWAAVGGGGPGGAVTVIALVFGLDGILYIGGSFANWGGVAFADNLVQWDGAAYTAVGGVQGPDGLVEGLGRGPNGTIYLGGTFLNVGGVAANRIASWDGSTFAALGSGLNNETETLVVDNNGIVYAFGRFTTAGGNSAIRAAQWNGVAWSAMGDGFNNTVWDSGIGPDGIIFVLGEFTATGSLATTDGIAKWTGSSWANLDVDLPGASQVEGAFATGKPDPVIAKNYDLWMGFANTGAAFFSGSITVANDGTQDAFPTMMISRSGGTAAILREIRNEDLGLELLFDYSLLDGETLTISLEPTVKSIISNFFGQRFDAILPNSDFGTWRLQPGNNQVTCFVDVTGGPTIEGAIIFSDQFWSMD